MATAVKKLLHPHRSREDNDSHSSGHERQDSAATERAREEEKHNLMHWEEQKQPLEPGQIDDSDHKAVGQSSNVLRLQDFELIKTLGTGAPHVTTRAGRR